MDISINKSDVLAEVVKRTSLEGVMIPERFEEVWASSEDGELLDSFWVEGCTFVVQQFKRYITSVTGGVVSATYNNSETFKLSVEMPSRYSSVLNSSISSDVSMIIACTITLGWLNIKLPSAAPKYKEEGNGYAEDLKSKLLYRTAPTQSFSSKTTSDSSGAKTEATLTKKGADSETMMSGEYYGTKAVDGEKIVSGEYYGTKAVDGEKIVSGEYYGEGTLDKITFEVGEHYSAPSSDEETLASGEYFGEGLEDDESIIQSDYFITKKTDNYNFSQYEKCNNYPKEGRDYERCGEHCPCNRS